MNPNLMNPSFYFTADTDFALGAVRKATGSSVQDSLRYLPVVKTLLGRDHPIIAEIREEMCPRLALRNLAS
ncbi:MAG: hypothetical protein LJE92_12150 [Gammaproteobacteria bacterium]|jgi:hypothetical protein|nr:hypothetical protein [Gammaproteobacteria bacterium]